MAARVLSGFLVERPLCCHRRQPGGAIWGIPVEAAEQHIVVTTPFALDTSGLFATCIYMLQSYVPTLPGPDELDQLKAWAEATEREIQEIKEAVAPLQERMENASQRLDLIKRLVHLSEAGAARSTHVGEHQHSLRSARTDNSRSATSIEPANSLEDEIDDILRAAGSPVHVSAIRERLIERGVPLPGKGEEANIIVRMGRSEERFTRTGKGTYGLSSWNFQSVTPTRKVKSRKRSKRAK